VGVEELEPPTSALYTFIGGDCGVRSTLDAEFALIETPLLANRAARRRRRAPPGTNQTVLVGYGLVGSIAVAHLWPAEGALPDVSCTRGWLLLLWLSCDP